MQVKKFNEVYVKAIKNFKSFYNYLNEFDEKLTPIVDIMDTVLSNESKAVLGIDSPHIEDAVNSLYEMLNTYNAQIKDIEKRMMKYRWKLEPYFEIMQQPSIDYYTLLNEVQILINIYKPILEDKLAICNEYFAEINNEI